MINESVSKVNNSISHQSILYYHFLNSEKDKSLEENFLFNNENDSTIDFSIDNDDTVENSENFYKKNLDNNCQESHLDFIIHENEITYQGNNDADSRKKIKLFIFYLLYLAQEETERKDDINSIERLFYGIRKNNPSFMLSKFKTSIYHKLHFIGNLLGLHCRGCKHQTQSHTEVGYGKWKCKDCKEGENICEINEIEVKQMMENLVKQVYDFFDFKF